MIIDDDPAVAVENAAAGREHRHGLDIVFFGALGIELGVADLQVPETRHEKDEHRDGQILERRDSGARELGIVAGDRRLLLIALEVGKAHSKTAAVRPSPLVYPGHGTGAGKPPRSAVQKRSSAGYRSWSSRPAAPGSAPSKRTRGRSRRRTSGWRSGRGSPRR